jgi:hypothetical protein
VKVLVVGGGGREGTRRLRCFCDDPSIELIAAPQVILASLSLDAVNLLRPMDVG